MIQTRGKAKNDGISVNISSRDVIEDKDPRDNQNTLGFTGDLKNDDVNKISIYDYLFKIIEFLWSS